MTNAVRIVNHFKRAASTLHHFPNDMLMHIVRTCVRTYVCTYVHILRTYVRTYTCNYVHTFVRTNTYTYVRTCVRILDYVRTYVRTYIPNDPAQLAQ
jgi:hypothetical protein